MPARCRWASQAAGGCSVSKGSSIRMRFVPQRFRDDDASASGAAPCCEWVTIVLLAIEHRLGQAFRADEFQTSDWPCCQAGKPDLRGRGLSTICPSSGKVDSEITEELQSPCR